MTVKHIDPQAIPANLIDMIANKWMLVAAAKDGKYNMMTANWGGVGYLWRKNVAFIFVRDHRYTYEFTEAADTMTLSFFGEEHREMLRYMGSKSGRDVDKCAYPGLTCEFIDGAPRFAEADVTLTVKKLYADWLKEECFLSDEPMYTYAAKDFHRVYIAEITDVAVRCD